VAQQDELKNPFSQRIECCSGSDLVRMKRGPSYGLQAKDFVIEDDGVEQVAQLDETAESQPISVIAIQTGARRSRIRQDAGLRSVLEPILNSHMSSLRSCF